MTRTAHFQNALICLSDQQEAQWLCSKLGDEFDIKASYAPDLTSCLKKLEKESYDWLLMPLQTTGELNSFNLTLLIRETPELRHLKVSVILEEDQIEFIGRILEIGALSFHIYQDSKEELLVSIDDLIQRILVHQSDFRLACADYIRDYLIARRQFDDLELFESSLLQYYPWKEDLLLKLAHAKKFAGKDVQCFAYLKQLADIAPSYIPEAQKLCKDLLPEQNFAAESFGPLYNFLGIETCLIVDHDFESARKLYLLLKRFGIPQIHIFDHPFQAMKYAREKGCPDVVFCNWQIPDYPTTIFIQRMQQFSQGYLPVVVLANNFHENDIIQIKDVGGFAALNQEPNLRSLLTVLQWIAKDQIMPQSPAALAFHIMKSARSGREDDVHFYYYLLAKTQASHDPAFQTIKAQLALEYCDFELAESLAIEVLKNFPQHLPALDVLGLSRIYQHRQPSGIRCLESAALIHPFHAGRISAIAEGYLEAGNEAMYQTCKARLEKIQPKSEALTELNLKVAIKKHQIENARLEIKNLQGLRHFVRVTNAKALDFIQNSKLKEGMAVYLNTLKILPQNLNSLRAIVYFNLGLTMARMEHLEEAEEFLECVSEKAEPQIRKRSASLLDKIRICSQTGTKLGLPEQRTDLISSKLAQMTKESKRTIEHENRRSGCCINIFTNTQSSYRISWNERRPKFKLSHRKLAPKTRLKKAS